MVNQFIEQVCHGELFAPDRNCEMTIFVEPKLLSGFPDIVLVYWHAPTTHKWPDIRMELTADDLKMLQLLVSNGPTQIEDLCQFRGNALWQSLEKLGQAGLIYYRAQHWHARSLENTFAIRKIIAFEAKVDARQDGISQAAANRWFANSSYLLLKEPPKRGGEQLLHQATNMGIGIWVHNGAFELLSPQSQRPLRQPLSYASWLLNEWAWQTARRHSTLPLSQKGAL